MPRVLRIINRLNLGGPTFNAALLTRHMSPEFETLLVAGTRQDSEESSDFIVKKMGVSFVEIKSMRRSLNPFSDYAAYKEIRRIIREFKPHIVHTHAAKAGALGRLAALHENVPVILHTFHGHVFHSYFNIIKSKFYLAIERFLAARSSAIVAISKRQKKELVNTYKLCPDDKVHIIPLGFDLSRFREDMEEKRRQFRTKYLLEDDEIAIGIIGRLVPVKNHSLFLRAASEVVKRSGQKLRFFIIGDGESRNTLINTAEILKFDFTFFPKEPRRATLTFTSWIRNIDVAMAGLDIITLTSFNEGTPVSLIEAQAAGKPIVSTNVGGIENVVQQGETALLVPSNDVSGFASGLLALTEDHELRERMSHGGWEYVKDNFHFTRLVRDMSELYNKLLQKSIKQSR